MTKITVKGAPIAKARPRFARRGKFVTVFNAQETEEGRWLWEAQQQITEKMEGPLAAKFHFHMPIPKSTSEKKRLEMIHGHVRHIKKPDLDNLVKFAKDCLNGVAWGDDSQVCFFFAWKGYSDDPRTEIEITRE